MSEGDVTFSGRTEWGQHVCVNVGTRVVSSGTTDEYETFGTRDSRGPQGRGVVDLGIGLGLEGPGLWDPVGQDLRPDRRTESTRTRGCGDVVGPNITTPGPLTPTIPPFTPRFAPHPQRLKSIQSSVSVTGMASGRDISRNWCPQR